MRIEVRRKVETSKSIVGELWVDGQWECCTLEPARINPVNAGHPAIPTGEYEITLTFSPHLKYVTPELLAVPGRSDIRVHVGNYPKDTLGCTLVGETAGKDSVYASKVAFDRLMTLLRATLEKVTIAYIDPEGK